MVYVWMCVALRHAQQIKTSVFRRGRRFSENDDFEGVEGVRGGVIVVALFVLSFTPRSPSRICEGVATTEPWDT